MNEPSPLRRPLEVWLRVFLAIVLAALIGVEMQKIRQLDAAIKEVHSLDRSVVREINKLREMRGIEDRPEGYQQRPKVTTAGRRTSVTP